LAEKTSQRLVAAEKHFTLIGQIGKWKAGSKDRQTQKKCLQNKRMSLSILL
jgi:hypothetical protein